MSKIVTLPETEYRKLKRIAGQHELVRQLLSIDPFAPPTAKNVKRIIQEFRDSGLYREPFLRSLERGLRESFSGRVKEIASFRELERNRRT